MSLKYARIVVVFFFNKSSILWNSVTGMGRETTLRQQQKELQRLILHHFPFNNENSNPKNIDQLKSFNYSLPL